MSIKHRIILMFFILLASCSKQTDIFVPNEIIDIDESETTVLRTDWVRKYDFFVGMNHTLYISSVNGQKPPGILGFSGYTDASKIPLGKNIIGLSYVVSSSKFVRNSCVTFIAKKGITYTAQKKASKSKIHYWVTDDTTKKIVSIPC